MYQYHTTMKYNLETLTSSQYLDMVNREENVDTTELNIRYCRIGNGYFAYANSAYGKIVTNQHYKGRPLSEEEMDELFEKLTEEVKAAYKTKSEKAIGQSSFLKNPLTPGL